jgi:hypothetical protein
VSHDFCILFAYHKVDALTRHHLELLKQHNPEAPIIPVTDDVAAHLEGGVDVMNFPDHWPKANPWRRCDTMLYRWFLNRNLTAERYVWLEYDVLCTTSIRDAYAEVWDADVACKHYRLPTHRPDGQRSEADWFWFSEINRLPEADRRFAAGLAPLACTMFSHRGLELITQNVTTNDVFCELRIGTAALKSGLRVQQFSSSLGAGIQWNAHGSVPTGKGVFHAVKTLAVSLES